LERLEPSVSAVLNIDAEVTTNWVPGHDVTLRANGRSEDVPIESNEALLLSPPAILPDAGQIPSLWNDHHPNPVLGLDMSLASERRRGHHSRE
jgi:hypothetical protein